MKCVQCDQDNPSGARFCNACGGRLGTVCPACRQPNEASARFCGACGAALQAVTGLEGWLPRSIPSAHASAAAGDQTLARAGQGDERKQVTVLFADIKGSMELLADRDPEEARRILDPVLELMIEAVHRYEGTVNQVMGDGIMALFGAPFAQEDHGVRACYAALRMQESVKRYADVLRRREGIPVRVRIGMNSGEVVVRYLDSDVREDYTAVGQTTHLAGRMEQMADPGTILITTHTHALAQGFIQARPLGPLPVRGLTSPLEVFELTGADPMRSRLHAAATQGLSPFVNRHEELQQIHRTLERAETGQGGSAVVMVGEPGVGKSRIMWEITHSDRTQGWLVLQTRAVSHGTAVPYLPVLELLNGYFQLDGNGDRSLIRQRVTERIEALDPDLGSALPALLALLDAPVDDPRWLALEPERRRHEIQDAVGRLLLRESQVRPVLAVFEDLQWSDSETRTLLESLVDKSATTRLVLLVNCRSELRPSWGDRSHCLEISLQPLDPKSVEQLLRAKVGNDPQLEPVRDFLIQRTEGNPFFLEESVRTLAETEVLAGEPGAYHLGHALPSMPVPATVQAVIAARIDRLAPEEKRLLQSASVIGKDLSFALLRAVSEMPEDQLRKVFGRLQAAEFLYETSLFPNLEFTFRHSLTHEVAYGGLLHERRRSVHARIVEAIEELHPGRLDEGVEQLAQHALLGELWEKAVAFLRKAAGKAMARSAYREAGMRLEQALGALSHLPKTRALQEQGVDLRLELRAALTPLGEHAKILTHLGEADALARSLGDDRRMGRVYAYLADCHRLAGKLDQALVFGERSLAVAQAHNDLPLLVAANIYLGQIHNTVGQYHKAIEFLRRNIEILVGDLSRDMLGLPFLSSVHARTWLVMALAETGEFTEGVHTGEEGTRLAEMADHPPSLTSACAALGVIHVRRGDAARAIPVLERAAQLAGTWSVGLLGPMIDSFLGSAYVLGGQPDRGLPLLERAVERQGSMRRQAFYSLRVAGLAEAHLALGQMVEATTFGERALALARGHGERGIEAHVLRLLGDIAFRSEAVGSEQAEAAYEQARSRAEELGMIPLLARCHRGLGQIGARAQRRDQAVAHFRAAAERFSQMGMSRWLEETESELRRLG